MTVSTQAANSIERLRNFVARLKSAQFAAGSNPEIQKRADEAEADFDAGLADDLNTAVALATVFDLVRDVNTAMDRGDFPSAGRAAPSLATMEKFDAILAVLADDDDDKLRELGFGSEPAAPACRTNRRTHRRAQCRQKPPRFQTLR